MPVLAGLQRVGIVAQDLEHPEDRPLPGDALAHVAMAALDDFDTRLGIGPDVGFAISPRLEIAHHHQPRLGMHHFRR